MNEAEEHKNTKDKQNSTEHLTPNEALVFEQETPSFAGTEPTENEQGTESAETSPALSDADESKHQALNVPEENSLAAEPLKERGEHSTQPTPTVMTIQVPAAEPTTPAQQSGGILVLQWLTYAFWFWLSISISWLAGVVVNYYIANKGSSYIVWSMLLAYPLASVIITFLIALVADKFYSKHEPTKKVGGANVIMLLHVVPFVLLSIGALITLVFALITMLLNSDPVNGTDGPLQIMLVALIVAILFALAAVRVFYGARRVVRLVAWGIFALLAIGFIIAGFAGPGADSLRTKDDRLIEQSLPDLAEDIREYANKNNILPEKLTDVTHTDSSNANAVQALIDKKLVVYKANTLPAEHSGFSYPDDSTDDLSVTSSVGRSYYTTGADRFYYQLCVVYKSEKKTDYNYTSNDTASYTIGSGVATKDSYSSAYITHGIDVHPVGNVCYNLYADGKYKYSN